MTASTQDWTHFLNRIRLSVIGASDAGIKNETFAAVQEFFKDSLSWLQDISVPILAATTTYELVPDAGIILQLIGVVDPNKIPQAASMPTLGTLTLRDKPNGGQTWTATVALTASLPQTQTWLPEVPDWLLPVWGFAIEDGVKGRMFNQPSKGYSNEKLAIYHLKRFRDGIVQARVAALRQNTFGANNWRYPQQFRMRSQRGGVSVGNDLAFE